MTVVVTSTCPFCGTRHQIRADADALRAWEDGQLIQHALPDLDVIEREQLITGLCPNCQDTT